MGLDDTLNIKTGPRRLDNPSFGTILELLNQAKFLSRAEQSYSGKSKKSHVRASGEK